MLIIKQYIYPWRKWVFLLFFLVFGIDFCQPRRLHYLWQGRECQEVPSDWRKGGTGAKVSLCLWKFLTLETWSRSPALLRTQRRKGESSHGMKYSKSPHGAIAAPAIDLDRILHGLGWSWNLRSVLGYPEIIVDRRKGAGRQFSQACHLSPNLRPSIRPCTQKVRCFCKRTRI